MKHLVLALVIAVAAGCSPDPSLAERGPADDSTVTPPPADTTAPPSDDTPLAPVADASNPGDGSTVPARFQGTWATDAAACSNAGNESHLTIAADRITFHESTGTIESVTSGPTELSVVARVTGEGETREATYRFGLSDDGNTLTDLSSGIGMVRQRCG